MESLKNYKFKVYPKKLASGKCQVKFVAQREQEKGIYGYALVDSKITLKEVIEQLEYGIKSRPYNPYFLNSIIFKTNSVSKPTIDYLFFNS
jgi:hypothetical protein